MNVYDKLISGETVSGEDAVKILQDGLERPAVAAIELALAWLRKDDIASATKVLQQLVEILEEDGRDVEWK